MRIIHHSDAPQILFGLSQLPDALPLPLRLLSPTEEDGRRALNGIPSEAMGEQDYVLLQSAQELQLIGHPTGTMYGLFDLADALKRGAPLPLGRHTPRLLHRGVKFNIPLDARTPSYSDAADSAWQNIETVWDFSFWKETLDSLALNKYNVVSLWNLHPFPSMVRVPGYEDVALEDVMRTAAPVTGASMTGFGMSTRATRATLRVVRRMTMDEKIRFWQDVMAYGEDRGIRFVVMTWNVFIYGTEHTRYGITDSLSNPVTVDYFRKSVAALIRTYPKLYGIGVTAGERMSVGSTKGQDVLLDLKWLHSTYGAGIKDALTDSPRDFRFIHRQHFSSQQDILGVFDDLPVPVDFSFKYSQAHMYSSPAPKFAARFLSTLPSTSKTWLTLRNDSLYMLQWGGVEFAREYLSSIPEDQVIGFLYGPDGYTIARSFIEKKAAHPPVVERKWYEFSIWGRLGYDLSLPASAFEGRLRERTGCSAAEGSALFALCECASKVMPTMNQAHWHDFDFQHYPEGNMSVDHYHSAMHMGTRVVFHGIHDYLLTPAQPQSQYLGVAETVQLEQEGRAPDRLTPLDAAQTLRDLYAQGRSLLPDATGADAFYVSLREDCVSMLQLGHFFADMLECALLVQRLYAGLAGSADAERALALAQTASEKWLAYSSGVMGRYRMQTLTRFNGRLADFAMADQQAIQNIEDVRMLVNPFL